MNFFIKEKLFYKILIFNVLNEEVIDLKLMDGFWGFISNLKL